MDTENPTGLKHHEIKNIKKNNIIEFIGFQKDISNLYSNSHIICCHLIVKVCQNH